MNTVVKNVLVVGAGIGGLTVANALLRKGLDVKVVEKAPAFSPTAGAGFGLSPNGLICLDTLGLAERCQAIMYPLFHHHLYGRKGRLLVHADHLSVIFEKYALCLGGAMRADVVDLLAAPLEQAGALYYNHEVSSLTQSSREVVVGLTDGTTLRADLVIGADGIHSSVARALFGDGDPPRYGGENIFFGVIEKDDGDGDGEAHLPSFHRPNTVIQRLDQGEFVYYPVGREGKAVWVTSYRANEAPGRGEWEGEGGGVRGEMEKLLRRKHPEDDYPAWECLSRTKEGRILHFGLFDRKHRSRWAQGRVTLLGDAAHATLPYMSQGANQAVEDAVVLVKCLEHHGFRDPERAIQDYYDIRHKRTKLVVDVTRRLGVIMHTESLLGELGRDWLLSWLSRSGLFLKVTDDEIVQNCPVPYDRRLYGLKEGWRYP